MKLFQKILYFGIVLAIVAGSYYLSTFFFAKDPEAKIYEACISGSDTATQQALEDAKTQLPPIKYSIFEAALFSIENNTLASVAMLRDAENMLNEVPEKEQPEYLANLQIIRACNLWQEQKRGTFDTAIASFGKLRGDPFYMTFFEGLNKINQGDCPGAIAVWEKSPREPHSVGLLSLCFEKSFSEYSRALFMAEAYIGIGQYEKARALLKKPFPEEYAEKEVTLALKSFFKQASAEKNSALLAEMAATFLQELATQNPSWVNYSVLQGKILYDNVCDAIVEQNFPKILFGFALSHKLGAPYIMSLIREFDTAITSRTLQMQPQANELLATLKAVLANDEERAAVATSFADKSLAAINDGNIPEAIMFIAVVRAVDPTFDFAPYREKIKGSLFTELDKEAKVGQKFEILSQYNTPEEEKAAIRKALLEKLFSTWGDPASRAKIIAAIGDLASVCQQDVMRQEIMPFLSNLYEKAQGSDSYIAIFNIEKAIGGGELAAKEEKKLAEHAKNAESDFAVGNFSDCLDNLNILLYFTPDNKKFLKLKALALYQKGSFVEADAIFEMMKDDPEISAAKKLMMVERADEKERARVLSEMIAEGKLSEKALFDMGLDEALYNHIPTACLIFEKIQDSSIEAKAMFAATAYLEGSYEIAYGTILALPALVQKQHAIEAIALSCLVGMKKYDEAKKMVACFAQKAPYLNLELPPKMQLFFTHPALRLNRSAALVNYYLKAEENPIQALATYDTMKTLTDQDFLIRGTIEMELGLFEQARKDFLAISQENIDRAIALGRLAAKWNNLPESAAIFKELLKTYPYELAVHSGYAEFLRASKRYDLAEKEYLFIESKRELSCAEELLKIDTLFQNRKGTRAVECIKKLEEKNICSYSESIELARIASRIQYQKPLNDLLATLPQTFSPRALFQILKTALEIGYYNEAITIASNNEATGHVMAPVALELGEIYSAIGDREKSIEWVKKALTIAPSFTPAQEFLDLHEENPEYLTTRAIYFEEIIKKANLQDPMPLFAATNFFLRMYDSKVTIPGKTEDDLIYIFRCCSSIFERMVGKKAHFIEANYLCGCIWAILGQLDPAMKQLKEALSLCPSYWQALEIKGRIELQQKNYFDSKATFTDALNFAPNKANLWLGLSQAAIGCHDLFSAKFSLQQAVRFAPNHPIILIETASLLFELKTPEMALTYLKKGLTLAPNNVDGLRLFYLCLYDPIIAYSYTSQEALAKDRKTTFDRLKVLAPDVAEKLKSQNSGLKIDFK